jgi:hypothetical protein
MNDLYVYVCPISGGAIISHLALLQEVYDARLLVKNGVKKGYFSYAPHIFFGSSGGNICGFLGLASDWTSHGINRNLRHVNSDLFMKKWVNDSLIPDIPFALAKGSLYNKGKGARGLFNILFNNVSIQKTELWLGCYDIKHKKAQFFCNKNNSNSFINEIFFNEEQSLHLSMPLKFLDGNIDTLADVAIASATIPAVVPSKEVDGLLYADGGVMYSSPLSVLYKELLRNITGKERVSISKSFQKQEYNKSNVELNYSCSSVTEEKKLKLFYFYPYQPNGVLIPGAKKDLGIKSYLDSIINVSMIQDRNTAIEILNILSPKGLETETFLILNSSKLADVINFLETKKHYVICLFPHGNPSINIAHIDGDKIKEAVDKVKLSYGATIWYEKD